MKKLLEAARRREIDVVLVWRWIAGAGQSLIYGATLQELHHLGVGFISLTEEILRERTLAGLAQAEWKRARCVAANAISPLRKGEPTEVLHMASEDACEHDMLVQIRWQGRKMAVPLSATGGHQCGRINPGGDRRLALLGCTELYSLRPRRIIGQRTQRAHYDNASTSIEAYMGGC